MFLGFEVKTIPRRFLQSGRFVTSFISEESLNFLGEPSLRKNKEKQSVVVSAFYAFIVNRKNYNWLWWFFLAKANTQHIFGALCLDYLVKY